MVVKHQLEVMMQFPKCLKTFSYALKSGATFFDAQINRFESIPSTQFIKLLAYDL